MTQLKIDLHKKQVLNINTYKSLHWAVKGKLTENLRNISKNIAEEHEHENLFFDHFKVSVSVLPPTRRRLDPVNLYPTVKAIIDGLTDAGWWEDDDFKHLLEISFKYGGLSGIKDHFTLIIDIDHIDDQEKINYVLESEVQ